MDTSEERERGRNKLSVWDYKIQNTMYEINKQQRYMVQHRELQLLFCNYVKCSIIHKNIECLCCISESSIIFVNQLYLSKKDRTYKNKRDSNSISQRRLLWLEYDNWHFLSWLYLDTIFGLTIWTKNLPAMQYIWVRSLGWEDPLEKGMATYSSILAWRIPWTEETGEIQPMGLQRVEHDWVTNAFAFHFWA